MDVGRLGVWWSGTWTAADRSHAAHALEEAGYGALWSSGGFRPGLSSRFGRLLEATHRLVVASGIVSIWTTPPEELARAVGAVDARFPGRFLLGLGTSHGPLVADYAHPYRKMVGYLDSLDSIDSIDSSGADGTDGRAGGAVADAVGKGRRVLAALGPRMLELAATRSAGAHPYFVPAEHTERARQIMGPGPLLAPEVTVLLEPDAHRAREVARRFTSGYLSLPNYSNNLRSLGFDEDDLAGGGSDRLVDAVVAHGDLDAVVARVRAHYEAGADHVALQVLGDGGREEMPLEAYRELAEALLAG